MWRMYCVCLLSVIVVLDLLGQSHVNRNSVLCVGDGLAVYEYSQQGMIDSYKRMYRLRQ